MYSEVKAMKIFKIACKQMWSDKPAWEKKGWTIVFTMWLGMNAALLLPNFMD